MKIKMEMSLENFEAWAGAVGTKEKIIEIIEAGKAEEFEAMIDELYPDGIDATQLNDLLWFDAEWLYESLGMITEEEEEEE